MKMLISNFFKFNRTPCQKRFNRAKKLSRVTAISPEEILPFIEMGHSDKKIISSINALQTLNIAAGGCGVSSSEFAAFIQVINQYNSNEKQERVEDKSACAGSIFTDEFIEKVRARAESSDFGLNEKRTPRSINYITPKNSSALAMTLVGSYHEKYDLISIMTALIDEITESNIPHDSCGD
jgi:hypothetical protein